MMFNLFTLSLKSLVTILQEFLSSTKSNKWVKKCISLAADFVWMLKCHFFYANKMYLNLYERVRYSYFTCVHCAYVPELWKIGKQNKIHILANISFSSADLKLYTALKCDLNVLKSFCSFLMVKIYHLVE